VLHSVFFALLGGLIGNELCVALFVHPTLYQVADESHLRVAQPLARLLGRIMPFWYFIVLVLGIAESILCRGAGFSRLLLIPPPPVTGSLFSTW
jgi:hypothetical protein